MIASDQMGPRKSALGALDVLVALVDHLGELALLAVHFDLLLVHPHADLQVTAEVNNA